MDQRKKKLDKALLTALFSFKNHSKQLLFFSKYLLLFVIDIFKIFGLLVLLFFYTLQQLKNNYQKKEASRVKSRKHKKLQKSFYDAANNKTSSSLIR